MQTTCTSLLCEPGKLCEICDLCCSKEALKSVQQDLHESLNVNGGIRYVYLSPTGGSWGYVGVRGGTWGMWDTWVTWGVRGVHGGT